MRVLGDTGHGQQLVHAADGQHESIVRQRAGERDGDTAWFQDADGDPGAARADTESSRSVREG
jgi:hypothetical protein